MMGNKDQAGRTCATPQGEAECEHWSRLATTSILRAGPTSFASAPQSFFGNNQVTIFNYLNQCPPLSFSLFPAQPKGWSLQLATRSRTKVLSLLVPQTVWQALGLHKRDFARQRGAQCLVRHT